VGSTAVFPRAALRTGMYESFYLRAFSPLRPLGVWLRYTAHKRPGRPPRGSLWFTLFDADRPAPLQRKLTGELLRAPVDRWIAVDAAALGPTGAEGSCEGASWSLRWQPLAPELRHLRPALLYRAPLPRTKLTSPAPLAEFAGTIAPPGEAEAMISAEGWRGMVGHNWGSEHAERWIWLHGAGFEQDGDAWLDVSLGRVRVAGHTTPWLAAGALSLRGRLYRLGGLGARGLEVSESALGAELRLPGANALAVTASVSSRRDLRAGWRYADPDGAEHDVVNCSLARVALTVALPGGETVALDTGHGGAYELGVRTAGDAETSAHDVTLAPYGDG
jgi:hypothetical protein